ncbi:MAG: nucleotidyltransferase domain-containing protein [Candidatus Latescibacterota bacterium]|jgi:predicted nucleotidyltransferase
MVPMETIREYSQRLGREFHPQRVVLFGSYARGVATEDSDVDLLVVMPFEGKPWKAAAEFRGRVRPGFPLDLMVRTPQQVHERLSRGDTYLETLMREGVVLHEG